VRLRLWHRWFLLSAGLVLVAVASLVWVQERGFRSGLLDHANTLERERLPALAERFAEFHRLRGGWQGLRRNPQRLRHLVRPDAPRRLDEPPPRPFGPPRAERAPPVPPRRDRGNLAPRAAPLDFIQRLSLVDADGRLVIGPPPSTDAVRQPVIVDGRVVGELMLRPMPELQNAADLDFAREQRWRALWVALGVLLAAVLASFAMARPLLRRVEALTVASRRLAAGDTAVRVGPQGRDELGELASDFDRMADALQRAQEARDRWIADISHELRTPLTILRGELQALQDGVRPLDASAVASLEAEAGRLAARIDDLYALALSDSGGLRYRFERLDLSALVDDVARARRAVLEGAGLHLHVAAAGPVWIARGDAARLAQLLDNLLVNAQRYTDAGGEVRVAVGERDGTAEILVDDSAPGVPEPELSRLLDRHYRAGRGPDRRGGAGLGLAICRNIAEAHGGQLQIAASALGGLSVRIALPKGGPP
jgi:two-component system sensor histidine kinase BaeS